MLCFSILRQCGSYGLGNLIFKHAFIAEKSLLNSFLEKYVMLFLGTVENQDDLKILSFSTYTFGESNLVFPQVLIFCSPPPPKFLFVTYDKGTCISAGKSAVLILAYLQVALLGRTCFSAAVIICS